jgi:RNA polymerase sigma-70 factor (family 1)
MRKRPNLQEKQLLEELRKGNASAFEHIFRMYWKPLYSIAKSKVNSHDEAEEVLQLVFSNLWEQRDHLHIDNLSAYLYTAVKNRIINTIRSRITQEKYWDYYRKFIPQIQNTTENIVALDDMNEVLEAAVNRLPEKSRKVFKLSRFEGRTNSEIANLLKISEKAIEYHLTKSLKVIKLHMKDYISVIIILHMI